MKIFGIVIIFLVTLLNFATIEDDSKMRESLLGKEIEEQREKLESRGLKIKGKTARSMTFWGSFINYVVNKLGQMDTFKEGSKILILCDVLFR